MTLKKEILPAVAVAIFNERGEILLQKRKDVNQWCVISGHVDFGETIQQAVLREIKEETGKDAVIVRFIGIYSSPESQTYYYRDRSVQYVTAYFEAKLTEEIDPTYVNSETLALGFFALKNLPKDLAKMNLHWLTDALDEKGAFHLR